MSDDLFLKEILSQIKEAAWNYTLHFFSKKTIDLPLFSRSP